MMLSDMRERGSSDEELRELVTPENYERYKKISYGMCAAQVKGDFAIRHIMQQQSLVVDRARVDEEVMTLQAQAMQRGEKFKESETRPKVEAQLQKDMVLDWLVVRALATAPALCTGGVAGSGRGPGPRREGGGGGQRGRMPEGALGREGR